MHLFPRRVVFFSVKGCKNDDIQRCFHNNGSHYATKFLPNEVKVLILGKLICVPKLGKASKK